MFAVGLKYLTKKGYAAQIVRHDPTIENYNLVGYIMAHGQDIVETSWNDKGVNISNKKFNLIQN